MKLKTFIFCVLVLSGCAMQQDVTTLDDRLMNIEKQNTALYKKSMELQSRMDAMDKARERNVDEFRKKYAGQRIAFNEIREKIQTLNGKREESEYLLKQKIRNLEDTYKKNESRLERIKSTTDSNKDRVFRIEQYLNLESVEPGHATPQDSTLKPVQTPKKELSESEIYSEAKRAFDQETFETAREAFQRLIKLFPKSQHADNAQFWIGETYYREKWYEKAILEYQKVIEKYPKGNKVAASLLKQGFAFYNLGDKANARLILTELIKKYPDTNESKIAKKKLKGY